jgi:leucyl-tRNA---protein transferase
MNEDNTHNPAHLRLFRTSEHNCSYLPGLQARTLFIDPEANKGPALYQSLLDMGFRRSGSDIYRSDCHGCNSCISMRLPVGRFAPRRSQRRVWNRHLGSVKITIQPAEFRQDHFDLYVRYLNSRHPESEMSNPSADAYCGFLISPWCDTRFVEFRTDDRLLSVAVIDLLPHGISAVYTFFDPDMDALSPGVLAILWQVNAAKRFGLPWLYLGYWVPGCKKMDYKQEYRPIQVYSEGDWKEFSPAETITIPELVL